MNFHSNYSSNWTGLMLDYPRYHLLHFPPNNLNDATSFAVAKMDSYFALAIVDVIDDVAMMTIDFVYYWKTN